MISAAQYGVGPRPDLGMLDSGAEQFRVSFVYYRDNLVSEQETYFAGARIRRVVNTYNEKGDIEVSIVNDSPAFRCEYEYDGYGNWVGKTVLSVSGAAQSYHRHIAYYEQVR